MGKLAILGGNPVIDSRSHQSWPVIDESDYRAVRRVLARTVLTGATAPEVVALEKEWAWRCGRTYCMATNSGTSALHCAVAASGVEAGAEVILPALSFIATAFAVAHQGAVPVFADVDPITYNLDTKCLQELITPRTAAILPVHLHGLPADMHEICALADQHGLAVIEDAAQAHGAMYRGQLVGGFGIAAAFSLNATKGLPAGEGGLFVTDDPVAFQIGRRLALCGEDPEGKTGYLGPHYLSHSLGWNYRCPELSAAVARAQLTRLRATLEQARRNAAILNQGLAGVSGVQPPAEPPDRTSSWHKYRLMLHPDQAGFAGTPRQFRKAMIRALQAEGVAATTWQTHALPDHPAFAEARTPWRSRGEHRGADSGTALVPVARAVLDGSLILGGERTPICVQSAELMQGYVEAVRKVIDQAGNLPADLAE